MTASNHIMETLICAGKIGGAMGITAIATVMLDATTNVPILWMIAGIGAIAGGVWKIPAVLTNIEDRIKSIEIKCPHCGQDHGKRRD